MLDHIVAGGLPYGIKIFENVIKECGEEANIPVELPNDFIPTPVDGEVEIFQLQTIDWVLQRVIEGGPNGYKPNCNLVLIDFFIRYGVNDV